MSVIWIFPIKLGYEIWLFEVWKHLKSGLFEGRISNDTNFKESEFSYGYSYTVGIWNPETFEIRTFRRSDFKWSAFSNGRALAMASGIQIPFKIQTICNPTSFEPFEIQNRSDFRTPLYFTDVLKGFTDYNCPLAIFLEKIPWILDRNTISKIGQKNKYLI